MTRLIIGLGKSLENTTKPPVARVRGVEGGMGRARGRAYWGRQEVEGGGGMRKDGGTLEGGRGRAVGATYISCGDRAWDRTALQTDLPAASPNHHHDWKSVYSPPAPCTVCPRRRCNRESKYIWRTLRLTLPRWDSCLA